MTLLIFDVNETLTDLEPLRARLAAAGADPDVLKTWFAATLRDGIALTLAGGFASFDQVAEAALMRIEPAADAAEAVRGLSDAQPQDDVAPALESLAAKGVQMITLSNGAAKTAATALERAGVAHLVERNLSVQDVGRWKPAPEPYAFACDRCGVAPAEALLVSVHPWDAAGASRAGMRACFVNRDERGYPSYLEPPDITVTSLIEIADEL